MVRPLLLQYLSLGLLGQLEVPLAIHLLLLLVLGEELLLELLLPLFNLLHDTVLDVRLGRAPATIYRVHGHHEEADEEVHVVLVLYHEVHVPILELQGYALPRVEWQHGPPRLLLVLRVVLYLVELEAAHVFAVDPEARVYAAVYYALDVRNVRAAARLRVVYRFLNFLDLVLDLEVGDLLLTAVYVHRVTVFLMVVSFRDGLVEKLEASHGLAIGRCGVIRCFHLH